MYTDLYELLERFSIMTVDAHLSDEVVLTKLKPKTTKELYLRLEEIVKNNDNI